MHTILIHGPSGVGKDTQVDILEKHIDMQQIGTGEMLRVLARDNDPVGLEAKKYWEKGELVPSETVYNALNKWLERYDRSKTWLLVSTVRKADQIPMLDKVLATHGRELDMFINLTLSDEVAIERMSLRKYCPVCNETYHEKYKVEHTIGYCDNEGANLQRRPDDYPESITKRLADYRKNIDPILSKYSERGILKEVDGSGSIAEVSELILELFK